MSLYRLIGSGCRWVIHAGVSVDNLEVRPCPSYVKMRHVLVVGVNIAGQKCKSVTIVAGINALQLRNITF